MIRADPLSGLPVQQSVRWFFGGMRPDGRPVLLGARIAPARKEMFRPVSGRAGRELEGRRAAAQWEARGLPARDRCETRLDHIIPRRADNTKTAENRKCEYHVVLHSVRLGLALLNTTFAGNLGETVSPRGPLKGVMATFSLAGFNLGDKAHHKVALFSIRNRSRPSAGLCRSGTARKFPGCPTAGAGCLPDG